MLVVPFGRRRLVGVVVGLAEHSDVPPERLVEPLQALGRGVPPELVSLGLWVAEEYCSTPARGLALVLPPGTGTAGAPRVGIRRALVAELTAEGRAAAAEPGAARLGERQRAALEALMDGPLPAASVVRDIGGGHSTLRSLEARGLVALAAAEQRRRPRIEGVGARGAGTRLTEAQRDALQAVERRLDAETGGRLLLHGVTGSGKTEVYLRAAEEALAAGRSVLVLVPEIALTHQLVERVRARFGERVAVLHSGLGPRERWDEWRRVRAGAARVVVGARSAVFAPLGDLGLVVVDEEHDAAYKQEDGLRYNARDLAVVRARLAKAVVVLASATPSAETYHAAQDGRHALLELPERPTAQALPAIDVVDLRERPGARATLLTDDLREALEQTLAAGRQSLVFLNRRGFATYLQCPACGVAASCDDCSVTLTWHRAARALVCHHCHHHRRPPPSCPACHGPPLEAFGVGTEQIESALQDCYPLAAVGRLDRDAAQRVGAQRRILAAWRAGDTDILVGTQMVSKGHDVPNVTLVAVLLADLSLNVPDFRAGERTFQLLVQVAGRAGRGDAPGRVLVQTLRREHPSIAAATRHDYAGFIEGELARRRALGYPPFARLVNVRIDGRDAGVVEREAARVADVLRRRAAAHGLPATSVLGPAAPPLERVRGRFRRQILLRASDVPALRDVARTAKAAEPSLRRASLRLAVDVDPYSML